MVCRSATTWSWRDFSTCPCCSPSRACVAAVTTVCASRLRRRALVLSLTPSVVLLWHAADTRFDASAVVAAEKDINQALEVLD